LGGGVLERDFVDKGLKAKRKKENQGIYQKRDLQCGKLRMCPKKRKEGKRKLKLSTGARGKEKIRRCPWIGADPVPKNGLKGWGRGRAQRAF